MAFENEPRVEGLEVTLEVDCKPVKEYQDPTDGREMAVTKTNSSEAPIPVRSVIRYVRSRPGRAFMIHVKKTSEYVTYAHHLGYEVVIDELGAGFRHQVRGEYDKRGSLTRTTPWEAWSSTVRTGSDESGYVDVKYRFPAHTGNKDYGSIQVGIFYLEDNKYEIKDENPIHADAAELVGKAMSIEKSDSELPKPKAYVAKFKRGPGGIYDGVPFVLFEFRYLDDDAFLERIDALVETKPSNDDDNNDDN